MKKVCLCLGLMLAVCAAVCALIPGILSDVYSDAASIVQSTTEKPVQIFGMMEITDYDEVGAFSEGLAPVRIGDKWGYMDRLGDLRIEAKWNEADAFSDGMARVDGDRGYGYIDRNGQLKIDTEWDNGVRFVDGYAWVSRYDYMTSSTDYYILDQFGGQTKVAADQVTIQDTFSEGLVVAYRGGKAGFINTKGEFEIDAVYDQANRFSGGLATASRDGKWGYINKQGRFVIPNRWEAAITFRDDGQGIVFDRDEHTYKFIGRSGLTKADMKWNVKPSVLGEPESVDEFFMHVRKWNKLADMWVTYVGYSEGLTLVKAEDGAMGFLDRNGNLVIDSYYDDGDIDPDHEWISLDLFGSGLALGKSNSGYTYGYINKSGQRVCEATYYEATRFNEGVATALRGGNYYHILYTDAVAQEVVDALFDRGEYEKIGDLVSRSAEKCYTWETYNGSDTRKMESFFEKTTERLIKEEAYLAAAQIYKSLWDEDACIGAYLMHAEKKIAEGEYEQARSALQKGRIAAGGMSEIMRDRVEDMLLRIDYCAAETLLDGGNYAEAANAFAALGDYEDAAQRVKESHYRLGDQLKAEGRMDEAMRMMVKAGDYADARDQVEAYYLPEVRALTARGEYRRAALALMRIGLPEFMREAYALRSHYLMDDRVAWDNYRMDRVLALSADGTLHTDYDSHGLMTHSSLGREKDLMAVEIGTGALFGLRRDGTVFSSSWTYDVSSWTDIVAIAAGEGFVVGLRADGTVVGTGSKAYGWKGIEEWRDVIAIEGDYSAVYGLCRDGSVLCAGNADAGVSAGNGWYDIIDLAVSGNVVGLRADGTILVTSGDRTWQMQAPEGTVSVASVAAVLCLLEDGTVAAPGGSAQIQFAMEAYRNLVAIIDGHIFIDSEGRLQPEEINDGIVLNESRASDRFVPPAVLMGEKDEWLAHAQELMENGAYRRAMELLRFRRDDPQADEIYRNAVYALAEELAGSGNYERADEIYAMLGDEERVQELRLGLYYQEGMKLLEEGEAERAAVMFTRAGDYQDAAQLAESIMAEQSSERYAQVEALRAEGRELEALYALRRLGDRKSLKEAYAGLYAYDRKKPGIEAESGTDWTLSQDGTIRLDKRLKEMHPTIENMSGFMMGTGNHKMAFGITPDGQLYRASRWAEDGWVLEAEDIVSVDCSIWNWIALREDGTVLVSWWDQLSDYYEVPEGALDLSGWTDIVAVEINDRYVLGLKKDGTVEAKGLTSVQMDVDDWTDIVDITSGRDISIGLKSDGTVVAAGLNQSVIREIESWTDIVEVAAFPSSLHVVGVRKDGSLVEAED